MNKYLEIIRNALVDVICNQPYPDSLTEEGVIDICDIVWEAIASINVSFVDKAEYEEFIQILCKYAPGENPYSFSLKMLEKIKEYHASLSELEAGENCKKSPEDNKLLKSAYITDETRAWTLWR
jgi:hypothetical protein